MRLDRVRTRALPRRHDLLRLRVFRPLLQVVPNLRGHANRRARVLHGARLAERCRRVEHRLRARVMQRTAFLYAHLIAVREPNLIQRGKRRVRVYGPGCARYSRCPRGPGEATLARGLRPC